MTIGSLQPLLQHTESRMTRSKKTTTSATPTLGAVQDKVMSAFTKAESFRDEHLTTLSSSDDETPGALIKSILRRLDSSYDQLDEFVIPDPDHRWSLEEHASARAEIAETLRESSIEIAALKYHPMGDSSKELLDTIDTIVKTARKDLERS